MIKLNAGISRKVGEPDYGSRGASVNVELEVESNLVNEPNALLERIRRLFTLARAAVDEELQSRTPSSDGNGRRTDRPRHNGNGRSARPATASQLRAIRAICERLGRDANAVAYQHHGVNSLDALTLQEASALIDELKAQAPAGNGGGPR